MRIIAFDLGSTFALAHNIDEKVYAERFEFPKDTIREHRLAMLMKYLEERFGWLTKVDAVIYERPFARGMAATRSLWGMAGVIEAVASKHGYPVLDMPPMTIKKFAAGKGNATKDEMTAAAQIYGYEGTNEHEADAVCLLRYAEANIETVTGKSHEPGNTIGRGTDRPAEAGKGTRKRKRRNRTEDRDQRIPAKRAGRKAPRAHRRNANRGRTRKVQAAA